MAQTKLGEQQLLAAEAAMDSARVALREAAVELASAELTELREEAYASTDVLQQLEALLGELRMRRSRVEAICSVA